MSIELLLSVKNIHNLEGAVKGMYVFQSTGGQIGSDKSNNWCLQNKNRQVPAKIANIGYTGSKYFIEEYSDGYVFMNFANSSIGTASPVLIEDGDKIIIADIEIEAAIVVATDKDKLEMGELDQPQLVKQSLEGELVSSTKDYKGVDKNDIEGIIVFGDASTKEKFEQLDESEEQDVDPVSAMSNSPAGNQESDVIEILEELSEDNMTEDHELVESIENVENGAEIQIQQDLSRSSFAALTESNISTRNKIGSNSTDSEDKSFSSLYSTQHSYSKSKENPIMVSTENKFKSPGTSEEQSSTNISGTNVLDSFEDDDQSLNDIDEISAGGMYRSEEEQALDHVALRPLLNALGIPKEKLDLGDAHRLLADIGGSLFHAIDQLNNLFTQRQEKALRFPLANMTFQPIEDNPIRMNLSTKETLDLMFTDKKSVHLAASEAVKESMQHVNNHQEATEKAIDAGLDAILHALSPDVLENRFKRYGNQHDGSDKSSAEWCWNMYKEYYKELCSHRQGKLQLLFWEVFAQEYQLIMRKHDINAGV